MNALEVMMLGSGLSIFPCFSILSVGDDQAIPHESQGQGSTPRAVRGHRTAVGAALWAAAPGAGIAAEAAGLTPGASLIR